MGGEKGPLCPPSPPITIYPNPTRGTRLFPKVSPHQTSNSALRQSGAWDGCHPLDQLGPSRPTQPHPEAARLRAPSGSLAERSWLVDPRSRPEILDFALPAPNLSSTPPTFPPPPSRRRARAILGRGERGPAGAGAAAWGGRRGHRAGTHRPVPPAP